MEDSPTAPASQAEVESETIPSTSKPGQFYLILMSLAFICFVASIDGSIITIALPRITNDLLMEGLRKHPPLTQLRERTVPPEGDVICGHQIPGGTFIGLNAWGTQLNSVFGDDSDIFRPERWLTADEGQYKEMSRALELVFGFGDTKCLGVNIARIELNKIFFELLRCFDITIANPYRPWRSACYGIFFQKDFNVILTSRPGSLV